MPRQKRPNHEGSYDKLKNGRVRWRQMKDGETRTLTAKNIGELNERVKKVADVPIIKNKLKVYEWFDTCLENIEVLKKSPTYEQYKNISEEHIIPIIGKRLVKNIKQVDIQHVITEMSKKTRFKRVKDKETGEFTKVDTGKKLSTWTMKHAKKIMHIFFEKAFKVNLIPTNPVYDIDIPKRQAKPRKTLKIDELGILFKYAKNTRWYWAMRFLLVTGLRRSELLALRWSDIDYIDKKIVIDESDNDEGAGDTKSAKVHYAALSDLAIYYLSKQKEMLQWEDNPILHNDKLGNADLIFPSKNGTLLKPDSFNSAIDRINTKAGIHVTPHMFRHTFVYMSKGLLSLSELQEILGHDESTQTLDIYGVMLSDTQKEAKKLDEAFKDLDNQIESIEKASGAKIINFFEKKKTIQNR